MKKVSQLLERPVAAFLVAMVAIANPAILIAAALLGLDINPIPAILSTFCSGFVVASLLWIQRERLLKEQREKEK